MADRFWSYDGCSVEWHATAEAARSRADDAISSYREEAPEGWSEEVEQVCWGETREHAVAELTPLDELDEYDRDIAESNGWDGYTDYHLAPVEPSGPAVALRDVADERARQDAKWGAHLDFPDATLDIRRFILPAEVARTGCDTAFALGRGTWAHILVEEVAEAIDAAGDDAALRAELVQVGAVAAAWIEAIDRREVARG